MELEMEAEKICLQLPISIMRSKTIQRNGFLPQLAGRVTHQSKGQACSEPYWEESCELRCIPDLQGLLMLRGTRGLRQLGTGEDTSEDLFPETADALRRLSRCGDPSGIMEQSLCQQRMEGGTSEKTLKSECHQEKGLCENPKWKLVSEKRMASEERRRNDKRSFSGRLHWVNSNLVSAAFSQNLCTEERGGGLKCLKLKPFINYIHERCALGGKRASARRKV